MDNIAFQNGDILVESETGKRFRVLSVYDDTCVLCEMDISKLRISHHKVSVPLSLITSKIMKIETDTPVFFDESALSDSVRSRYIQKRVVMQRVIDEYWPGFEGLNGKKPKPIIQKLLIEHNFSAKVFWRMCRLYLQSGMRDSSLIDSKAYGNSKGKNYHYVAKPGPHTACASISQPYLDDVLNANFQEALQDYKSGRQKTIRSAFDNMNSKHYAQTFVDDGKVVFSLLPASERPTRKQFYNYVHKYMTKEEKDILKTSAAEHRNDKRLLLSDSLNGVMGPGDMMEIDACEADVSLVASFDNNRTVGRPIVYFMIDVYTKAIIAMSVAFDNNSFIGLTNLFLNLADDKLKYCAKYGMKIENNTVWPSNIIPRRVRTDRGSDFKSHEFGRICNALGIEKILVTGGSGSLKGVVEQSFRQMHSHVREFLENYGYIEKRYDSNHHKEATLNIYQYTQMVVNFVLDHNRRYNKDYPLTKDMVQQSVAPIPATLWQYGVKKFGPPRPITDTSQYCFTLMHTVKARLSRGGISYKGLWYFPLDDPELIHDMFKIGTKHVPFEVHMDMRNIGAVYYLRDTQLIVAPLNSEKAGNADYSDFTMKEWEDCRAYIKELDAKGVSYNEELFVYSRRINQSIVDSAKKEAYSNVKGMRPAREAEKQQIAAQNRISDRLQDGNKKVEIHTESVDDEQALVPEQEPDINTKYENDNDAIRNIYGWDV